MLTVLVFIISLNCTQYDHVYFDGMAELFEREGGVKVDTVCYEASEDHTYGEIAKFHSTHMRTSRLADIYIYVFMDIKSENSKTDWGYGSDIGGIASTDQSAGFVFWRKFDSNPANLVHGNDIRKWNAKNVSVIWHEFMHLYYYKLGKSHQCHGEMMHKYFENMDLWKRYDKNLNLLKPDQLLGHIKQSYWYIIHPKPDC
jgi:hypothetical protein